MRSAKIAPPPCLPFDCYIKLSTKPIRGQPLPSTDRRIESADSVTIICQRYLLNINSSKIDQFKGSVPPNITDVLITGAIEITEKRNANKSQSVHVYYTGEPVEPPMLQPHQLPYATVVTLVVTFVKPSLYHTASLQIIPLQNVHPKLLEVRGTIQITDEPELPLDPMPEHVAEKASSPSVRATRARMKPQPISKLFYNLRNLFSV